MTFSSSLAFFDHLMNEGDLDESRPAFLATRTSHGERGSDRRRVR
jgi:hypothetical protein